MSVCVTLLPRFPRLEFEVDQLLNSSRLFQDTGAQPLVNDDGSLALAVNGEIYNHRIVRKDLTVPYEFKTHSDCEVIIPLVWTRLIVPASGHTVWIKRD